MQADCPPPPAPVLVIQADQPGHPINKTQYGVFFEELSHAGEGGLYAELVQNRSFEDRIDCIPSWTACFSNGAVAEMALETQHLLNEAQSRALRVDVTSPGTIGIANGGYWGIHVVQGRPYDLSFYAKSTLPAGTVIAARLESADGRRVFASCSAGAVAGTWKKHGARLVAEGSDPQGRLVLEVAAAQAGALWLDVVSLFPPTWKGRPNGARPDLAEMIARMKPGVIRFPGGTYVSTLPAVSPRWLRELGPIEKRPGHPAPGENNPWGYHNNDGFGFHEYLQFAEDLGAEPIYVFQGGADPRCELGKPETYLAGAALEKLIEEILAGIEYANGDASTPWGARRAANGHPAPFNMKYVQIGNENLSKPFHDNYVRIYAAIKARHPELQVVWGGDWIGNNQHGYKSDGLMPEGSAAELVDEHFYKGDDWFYQNVNRYSPAHYPRGVAREAKIFIGEASAMAETLEAALKEAAFLLGAEKQSDKVTMAVYAPLMVNENAVNWPANTIHFDSHRAYGTPSYYAQVMLSNHAGDCNLAVSGLEGLLDKTLFVNATRDTAAGETIVKIVNAAAEAREIRIDLKGLASPPASGREIVLTAPERNAANSFDNPLKVSPAERELGAVGASFPYTVRPCSFTVLRLK